MENRLAHLLLSQTFQREHRLNANIKAFSNKGSKMQRDLRDATTNSFSSKRKVAMEDNSRALGAFPVA